MKQCKPTGHIGKSAIEVSLHRAPVTSVNGSPGPTASVTKNPGEPQTAGSHMRQRICISHQVPGAANAAKAENWELLSGRQLYICFGHTSTWYEHLSNEENKRGSWHNSKKWQRCRRSSQAPIKLSKRKSSSSHQAAWSKIALPMLPLARKDLLCPVLWNLSSLPC